MITLGENKETCLLVLQGQEEGRPTSPLQGNEAKPGACVCCTMGFELRAAAQAGATGNAHYGRVAAWDCQGGR